MDFNDQPPPPEPEQEFVSARARRRRALRRAYFSADQAERAALFEHLAQRAYPSYELFVFALVAGVILGAGYFVNSQALLIFGILVAPVLTPWVGFSLATIAGSTRFFLQTFAALLLSSFLIFISGLLAGFASRVFGPLNFNEAFTHSRLWWPDFVTLTIGAVVLTISFVRSEARPYLPSALVAYGLFLPLCAAGFGLGSGVSEIWPQGLLVFLAHFAWAMFLAILTLFFLRFFPVNFSGFTLTGIVLILVLATITILTGFGQWIGMRTGFATPPPLQTQGLPAAPAEATSTLALAPTASPSQTSLATVFIGIPTQTPSRTPRPTQASAVPPTQTATSTVTAEPTPIIAQIRAAEGGGAYIRETPGGKVIATLSNGATVTIIPNDFQDVNGVIWVHLFAVIYDVRVEGWMIQSLLVTATPIPDWQASPTLEITSTP
ncbi:MAG: DUF389 domain-containing protein [Anaerolineales bacterium]|nr:DUF389 domain-containing protein [Anaerolineales bacterium]